MGDICKMTLIYILQMVIIEGLTCVAYTADCQDKKDLTPSLHCYDKRDCLDLEIVSIKRP